MRTFLEDISVCELVDLVLTSDMHIIYLLGYRRGRMNDNITEHKRSAVRMSMMGQSLDYDRLQVG